ICVADYRVDNRSRDPHPGRTAAIIFMARAACASCGVLYLPARMSAAVSSTAFLIRGADADIAFVWASTGMLARSTYHFPPFFTSFIGFLSLGFFGLTIVAVSPTVMTSDASASATTSGIAISLL